MSPTSKPGAPRGRGAPTNPEGRFEPRRFEASWDDLESSAFDGVDEAGPRTEVFEDASRSIIAENDSPDIPFTHSLNPYRGCEHGCAYCFARPSHAYFNLSSGLDFETKIFAKPRASELLLKEIARPGYRCSPLALGTNTDPYQPVERRLRITRGLLEVLVEHEHPFTIVTKSALVLRDLDLLVEAAKRRQTIVYLSVTTLDPSLASTLEPRAAAPARRIATLRELSSAGVPCGVLAAPMIPAVNDHEIERILEAAHDAGARSAGWILVRLPYDVKEIFEAWLRTHRPDRADKVLSLVRQARGGSLNDPRFGSRMRGEGPYVEILARRFEVAARRLGLDADEPPLDTGRFRRPGHRPLFSPDAFR